MKNTKPSPLYPFSFPSYTLKAPEPNRSDVPPSLEPSLLSGSVLVVRLVTVPGPLLSLVASLLLLQTRRLLGLTVEHVLLPIDHRSPDRGLVLSAANPREELVSPRKDGC